MTPKELEEILKRFGMEEGVPRDVEEKTINLSDNEKTKEVVSLLEGMKQLFQKEIMEEEAKIVALQEKLVKAKKGGCNG